MSATNTKTPSTNSTSVSSQEVQRQGRSQDVSPEGTNAGTSIGSPHQKNRLEKIQGYFSLASLVLGVCGALGTMFVWLAANFYTGEVQIQADRPVDSLTVKLYDHKGQEATFKTANFQLMPGKYHLEIAADDTPVQKADIEVQFRQACIVPVKTNDNSSYGGKRLLEKRHWWQLWRKN